MKARCKFRCDSVTDHGNGYKSVALQAVSGGSEENKSFHQATPNGKLEFSWANQNVFFEPGKEYYVDIEPSV
jgi:hypothetical protein